MGTRGPSASPSTRRWTISQESAREPDRPRSDLLLGQLAIRRRLVTAEQVDACLREQQRFVAQGLAAEPLGALLLGKGHLSGGALEELLRDQEAAFHAPVPWGEAWRADALFGQRIVAHGLASSQDVDEALAVQARLRGHGLVLRLGEILVARHLLTETQVRDALALQDKVILLCPPCGKSYNVAGYTPGKRVNCPGCSNALVPPSDGGDIRVAGSTPDLRTPPAPSSTRADGAPAATERTVISSWSGDAPAPEFTPHGVHRAASPTPAGTSDVTIVASSRPAPAAGSPPAASAASAASAGAPPAAARPEPAGEPFGRYRLLGELGRGGMGVVYKAWDGELKRIVALKMLLSEAGPGPEEVARFLREARSAGRLRHPNIVPVHDVSTHNGRHYFTMDFIDGQGLDAVKATLPPRRFLEVLRDVALALQAAHESGVVHRDVKPANILLDGAGRPYVTDFGLAKEVQEGRARVVTMTGVVVGTPSYMSPEQAGGEAARVGPRSDVWSLGVMLYEHLAGELPFVESSPVQTVMAILQREPDPPSRVTARRGHGRRVHRDLETIALKCLEKDPDRRYAQAGELGADLGRYLEGEPIEARPISTLDRWARRVRRHRALAATVATAAAVVAGIAVAFLLQRQAGEARMRELSRAEALAQAGKLDEAIRVYAELLREDPHFVAARLPRARALARAGRRAEARADLDELLALDAAAGPAWLERGVLRARSGDDAGAIGDLTRCLALLPGNELALATRGWSKVNTRDVDGGMADFEDAAARATTRPVRALALAGRGTVLARREELVAARKALDEALALDLDLSRAWLERGRLSFREGRFADAERDASEALARDAAGIEALLDRARARHALLADEGALEDANAARQRAPNELAPAWALARYTFEPAQALVALDALLVKWPAFGEASLLRGWLRLSAGDARAAEDFEEARQRLQRPAHALAGLAATVLRKGDAAGALRLLDQALAADPEASEVHGYRAEALAHAGDAAGARAEYENCEALSRAVRPDGIALERLESTWREYHDSLRADFLRDPMLYAAAAIVKMGRWLLREHPHCGRAALLQARALWMVGQFDRALALATEATQRDPYLAEAWLLRASLHTDVVRLREPATALGEAERAGLLAAGDPRAVERIGMARFLADDFAGALEAYDRALALAPDLAVLHQRRADALRALGREVEARASLVLARKARPDAVAAQTYLAVGRFFGEQGQFDQAVVFCTKALEEAPRSPVVLNERGERNWSLGKLDRAYLDMAHGMEIEPSLSVKFFVNSQRSLAKMASAIPIMVNIMEGVVRSNPDDPAALAIRALMHYLLRKWDLALSDVEGVLALNPEFAVMYSLRGMLRLQKGDMEGAQADLEEGDRRAPEGGVPQYFLAQHAALAGERARALELLRRCIRFGFDRYLEVIREEKNLKSLRDETEFGKLLGDR
ncbi:MAG: protein kinase [Planctomycetes bacterium]|nr:protein kinase [Planctomycetota bacterium]